MYSKNSFELFKCRECNRSKPRNYFISDSLCKKCAAKRRTPTSNYKINLGNEIEITSSTHKRLYNIANRTRISNIEFFGKLLLNLSFIISFLCFIDIKWICFWHPSCDISILFTLTLGVISYIGMNLIPKQKRIKKQILKLAINRKEKLLEYENFYISTEWKTLRKEIIHQSEPICKICGKIIKRKINLTVDHIKPRSKHPHLALNPLNMQILCRRCNSSKGTK